MLFNLITIIFLSKWIVWIALLPVVAASPQTQSFPDISFMAFNEFVTTNFSSKVSLATVLFVLFSVTDNTDLLSLHFRQTNPVYTAEGNVNITRWITTLATAIINHLGVSANEELIKEEDCPEIGENKTLSHLVSKQLSDLGTLLNLSSCDKDGTYRGRTKTISYTAITGVQIICPHTDRCTTKSCIPRSLVQATNTIDIPSVTLIKRNTIYKNALVMAGKCNTCQSRYYADHERYFDEADQIWNCVYLNSAHYLKIGQNTWVDREFSNAVISGMYSFHGSASAYADFWNNSYVNPQDSFQMTRRLVWQAFVHESIRTIGQVSNLNLETRDNIPIDDLTLEAFHILGENGVIRAADNHSCSECTQKYKMTADFIPHADPAATVGIDEGQNVPALDIPDNENPGQEDLPQPQVPAEAEADDDDDDDDAYVKMVIMDGIVMGPTVSQLFD
jgi:hypothetical protein